MSKTIIDIKQLNEGGINPKSKLYEQPLWELKFSDDTIRILGKSKMEEYLSKGYNSTVFQFKRWTANTTTGNEVRLWCVVFTDNSHDLCVQKKFYEMITLGHQRKDEEKYKKLEEELKKKQAPQNPALFMDTKKITTPEEKQELKEFREKFDPEEAFRLGLHLHDDEKIEEKDI